MPDARIRARAMRCNISQETHILAPAHNKGAQIAAYAGYRILRHPCGFEVTYGGWHLYTGRHYHDALDYISEIVVLSNGR